VNPSEILRRLEVDAVLLPIRSGTKCPNRKEWQKLSFTQTQELTFQRSLKNAPAIGVLLGSASGGLCSIDFDDDDFLKRFLEMNPKLEMTLRTTARRGANLWILHRRAGSSFLKALLSGSFARTRTRLSLLDSIPKGLPIEGWWMLPR
jgi:Bifunctional DNA primase/polymerase, N-terminal